MKRTLLLFLLLIWVQITAFSQGPYTINSSAGPNGTISPLGSVLVTAGTDQLFTITPSVGYYIATVFVDGIPQISDPSAYTFTNVIGAHTISATFHLLHLVLNKPSYAQSSEIGRGASFANDADASNESRWASTGNNPQWWKVDLQQICDITSIAIGNYFDGSRYYHYNIEVSSDDITYTTYVIKSDNSPVLEDGDLFNITATARYIRVNIIYNSSGPAAQICDFRVYGVPSPATFNITSSAGAGGTINPTGVVTVDNGADKTFAITPNSGFKVSDVLVDGGSVGAVSSYTFTNVVSVHTISAAFLPVNTITASAGTGGTITPLGAVLLDNGANQTFTIAPKTGFQIGGVIVDGIPQGAIPSYSFTNVVANHTISATFTVAPHLALGKLSYAQSSETGRGPGFANDGDASNESRWASQDANPQWWKVDLDGIFNVTSIVIRNYADGTRYYQYNIEGSTDDITYTKIAEKTSINIATDDGDTYSLNVLVKFIRVNILYNSAGPAAQICDFRVYGNPTLTISNVTANNKVYNGTTLAVLNTVTASLVGVSGSDNVTLVSSGAVGNFADKDAGSGKVVTISGFTITGSDAGKYTLLQPSTTANITALPVAVTATAGQSKIFSATDPTPFAYTLTPSLIGGDAVSGLMSRAAGENAGAYAFTLGTLTAGLNYTLSVAATPTFIITPKTIVVTANAGQTKIYGQSDPVFTYTNSPALETGDNFTGTLGRAAGVNVGTYAFTPGTLTAGSNYTLSISSTTTFSITPKAVIITADAGQTKIYGQSDPVFTFTNTPALETGDSFTGALGRTAGVNTGTYTFTLGTLSAGSNYTLSVEATPTFSITTKAIVVTADAGQTKIYGQSDPVFTFTNSPVLETGDSFTGALGRTAGVNTGIYAFTLGTLSAGSNYTLSVAAAPGFSIAQKAIVVTADAGQTGVYGQPDPVFTYSNSPALESGDSFTGAIGRAAGVSTGNYAFTLGTLSAGSNYAISVAATPTFNITPKSLNITGINAVSKIYDSNTTALLSGTPALAGIVSGDVVTIGGTPIATFISSDAANNVVVNVTGYTITGPQAGNYSLTQPSGLMANITARQLTIGGTFLANNKVYDGTTEATIKTNNLTLLTIAGIDDVNLVAAAAFSDVTVGTGKPVSLTGSSLSGTAASNYTLSLIGAPTALADISEFGLTVAGVTANNKVYDGTTIATLNTGGTTLLGILGTDEVNLVTTAATGTFVNKDVGTGKTVTTNGFALTGPDAGKYSLIQPTTTADITATGLTITGAKADNKVYDGTTSATLNTGSAVLEGIFGADIVSLNFSGITGIFSDKNVGTGKTVTTSGFNLAGIDAANYTLTQPSLTADVTQANLTVSGATVNSKVYDGTTVAALNTLSAELAGIFGTDVVTLVSTGASGIFADKNAGVSKSVSATGFTLGGTDAVNYILIQPSLTGDISPKTLTITANDSSKSYGTVLVLNGTEITVVGLVAGDAVPSFTLISEGTSALANTGTYPVSVSAGSDNNYSFVYVDGILTVNKATLTATTDDKSKVYGSSNPSFTISYSGFKNGESESVLDSPPVASTLAIVSSNTGIYPVTLSGGTDNNYELTLVEGSLEVQRASLIISAENKTRTYKQPNPAFTVRYSGFVLGQDQSVLDILPVPETTATINSDAGDYDINVSGAADANYSFIYNKGTLTINKADQNIIFSDIPEGLRMTQEYELKAVASSGLPVSFEVSDQNIGILNSNILTVKGDGQLTITALQEGDHNWNQALGVTQTIVTLPTFDNIKSLFTPNSDGVNDYWHIPDLLSYGNVQVTVYNRFGQTVYKSDSYKNDWDGTWNGNPLPSASYYYIIKSSEKGLIKGVVNIVR